jgi:dihydrodipicolinate synthase/N-acetylneuraminate lyase
MYEEMVRGSAGNMPAAAFADLYSASWDLYQADQRREATELWARSLALLSTVDVYGLEAVKYMLHLRGVFPNTRLRAERKGPPLDAEAKRAIAELLENVKPWLRA